MIPGGGLFLASGLPRLLSLSLSPTSLVATASSTGTVTIDKPAPPGGSVVALSSNDSHATVPATVTIAYGAVSATFTVSTTSVGTTTVATISALYLGVTQTAGLTITANTFTLTYAGNVTNRNIFNDATGNAFGAGVWNQVAPLSVVINAGVTISSTSTAVAALDTGAIGAGVTWSMTNNGTIEGRGGNGGAGGSWPDSAGTGSVGNPGGVGGPAFAINTAAIPTITNGAGFILSGGGGGGGGGAAADNNNGGGGGGGGGGFGVASAGVGGTVTWSSLITKVNGSAGTDGTISVSGNGGAGGNTGGPGGGGGGGGGGSGVAGGPGGPGGGGIVNAAGGAGGAPGKAINLNGHSAPTFVSGGTAPHVVGVIA